MKICRRDFKVDFRASLNIRTEMCSEESSILRTERSSDRSSEFLHIGVQNRAQN